MSHYKEQWEKPKANYSISIRCDDGRVFSVPTKIPEDMAEYLNAHGKLLERVHGGLVNRILLVIPTWVVEWNLLPLWSFLFEEKR